MRERTVVLIPSDDLGWDALRKALQERQDIRVIGEGPSEQEAIATIAARQPDVVISAACVGGKPARQLLTRLRNTVCKTTQLIVFAADLDPEDILPFAEIGVAGFLLWRDVSCVTLPGCLKVMLETDVFVRSPSVVKIFVERQRKTLHGSSIIPILSLQEPERRRFPVLTPQQREVLRLVAAGLSNREIADHLSISPETIHTHLKSIFRRLDVHTREEATNKAQQNGVFD